MPTINEIAGSYRTNIARLYRPTTAKDYSKRLALLERWCSMHGITDVSEINFGDFLDWVFYERGVSPRTRNNYRTWLRSFCSWMRIDMGDVPANAQADQHRHLPHQRGETELHQADHHGYEGRCKEYGWRACALIRHVPV